MATPTPGLVAPATGASIKGPPNANAAASAAVAGIVGQGPRCAGTAAERRCRRPGTRGLLSAGLFLGRWQRMSGELEVKSLGLPYGFPTRLRWRAFTSAQASCPAIDLSAHHPRP